MAEIEIREREGARSVNLKLSDERVRVEGGALLSVEGDIDVQAHVPSIPTVVRSILSEEALMRPSCSGSGVLCLEPSFGGFHVLELKGESWILERGAYWASEGGVDLGLHREPVITSLWAGEGFIEYKTKISGKGRAIFNTMGPVEEVVLKNDTFAIEGTHVVGRTGGLAYRARRLGRSLFSKFLSGESLMRIFEGTGRLLICRVPFYQMRLLKAAERRRGASLRV